VIDRIDYVVASPALPSVTSSRVPILRPAMLDRGTR